MKAAAALFCTFLFSSAAWAQPVTAVLRLRENEPGKLRELAQNVRNAQVAGIRTHYEPKEIRELAGPTASDYAALIAQLQRDGFRITSESPTHLWLSIRADSSTFDRVFGSRIVHQDNGKHLNLSPAQIPPRLSLIQTVVGLDNTHRFRPRYRLMAGPAATPSGIPPATIKTAYGFDPIYQSGLSGLGQDIAIATYSGFKIDDVNAFYQSLGLQPGPVVDQIQVNEVTAYDEGSAVETQLDAEFAGMMAPGASIHVFASADNSDAGELQIFTKILDDNRSKIINYSWGDCEPKLATPHKAEMDAIFDRAVAQGVNVMVASGDNGSDSCLDGKVEADWPAAHPDVVAVGGTTFALDTQNNIAETAWTGCGKAGGSGGGISALYASPAWQTLGAQFTMRSYPDVSFNADANSGESVYATIKGVSGWLTVGGTSMAAPQWSGFMALVGESRANVGQAPLGFLNPVLYGMDPTLRSSLFHDITTGNNCGYQAGPGWDAVTGWGSMNAAPLLVVLTNS
jgi:kumamolisin